MSEASTYRHPVFMPHYDMRLSDAARRTAGPLRVKRVGTYVEHRYRVPARLRRTFLDVFDIAAINVMHKWEVWSQLK